MSQGYAYYPLVRVTPDNGWPTIYDLRAAFSDARGPERSRLRYRQIEDGYEDVNHRARQTTFGFRVRVQLWFVIVTTEDHATLAAICTALNNRHKTVELSLDGGTTYRQIILDQAPSPRALRNKTYVGARHELRVETVDPIDDFPTMTATGGW